MSRSELSEALKSVKAEPLLPVERKLIGWSLGLGILLLVVLAWSTRHLS